MGHRARGAGVPGGARCEGALYNGAAVGCGPLVLVGHGAVGADGHRHNKGPVVCGPWASLCW